MSWKTESSEDYHWLKHLSWSGYSLYKKCPEAFRLQYVDKKIVPYNAYHSIGGKTVQKVFELFYNNEIWRRGSETQKTLEEILIKEYNQICSEETIDWNATESVLSKEALLESLHPLIASTLKLIKDQKLLGKYSRSEVKIQAWLDKVLIHGIADFVIQKDSERMILDGKLTRHRNKYLKRDQLVWYVMLYYLQHQIFIDKTAWIYYTFGELEWVSVSIEDVKRLYEDLKISIKSIKKREFVPVPSPDNCHLCDFKSVCHAGQQMELSRKKSAAEKQVKKYEESNSPLLSKSDIITF